MRLTRTLMLLLSVSLVLGGCGKATKTETADNSSDSSSSESSSSRPSRGGGNGGAQNSGGQSSGSAGGGQMSGDPERRMDDPNGQGQGGMEDMKEMMNEEQKRRSGSGQGASGRGGRKPTAAERAKNLAGAGGSGGAGPGNPTTGVGGSGMQGDPRENGNGGSGNGGSGGGQMSGDPRENGNFPSSGGSGGGEMSGDPRQNGNFPSSGGSGGGQMSGDPRSAGGGGAGASSPPGGGAGASSPPGGGAGASSPPGGAGGGFGRPGFAGNQPAADVEPETLKEKALAAFKAGDDDGGFQYMYGHYVAEDDGRSKIPLQFLPTAKRPRTSVRWGVGVVYKTNKGFSGDPPKIGEEPNVLPQARGGRNGGRNNRGGLAGRGGFSGSGAPGAAGGSGAMSSPGGGIGGSGRGGARRGGGDPSEGGLAELQYYTGEVGDLLVEALDKLRVKGQYGRMIAKVTREEGEGGSGFGPGPGGNSGTFSSSGQGGMIDDGRTAADRNRARGGGGGGGGFRGGANRNQDQSETTSEYKNLLPGVLMLGKAGLKTLQARAKAHGIDLLAVMEVTCKIVPSNGQRLNDTRIVLWDVSGPSPVRVGRPSTTLNNVRVWMARQKNDDEDKDPVRNAVNIIFESGKEDGFLAKYKIADMPELNQQQAMTRLKTLVPESLASGNPMPGLVELTYYREKGLLPEKAYVEAVNQVAGTEIGESLLSGSEEEREKALENLLPPNWEVNEAAAEDDDDDIL